MELAEHSDTLFKSLRNFSYLLNDGIIIDNIVQRFFIITHAFLSVFLSQKSLIPGSPGKVLNVPHQHGEVPGMSLLPCCNVL